MWISAYQPLKSKVIFFVFMPMIIHTTSLSLGAETQAEGLYNNQNPPPTKIVVDGLLPFQSLSSWTRSSSTKPSKGKMTSPAAEQQSGAGGLAGGQGGGHGEGLGKTQRFQGQVGPILELLKCYFFPLQIIFIDSYMTTTTYKWTLIALCTLQASCSHAAGQAEIQPLVWNHTSPIEKFQIIFLNHQNFFLVWARPKTKTVLKR